MFAYLKILPFLLLAAGAAYAGHWLIVNNLETEIIQLESDVRQYQAQNVTLQAAIETNEETIRSLEDTNRRQQTRVTNLTVSNNQLQSEKDEYLSIFRSHDLQRLALARPGLIEPRINNGTSEVFRQVEQDSLEISTLNE